jgi:DNA-directed RNA polymerase subunit omega
MNQQLLAAAVKVIPDHAVLINVVSLRVRQLARGAKALMVLAPGMSVADTALSEIVGKKLTFELTPGKNGEREPRQLTDPFSIESGGKRNLGRL